MSADKTNCESCGREIRQFTADKTGGVCRVCERESNIEEYRRRSREIVEDAGINQALAAPLNTDRFDMDLLRKAALPLNGTTNGAEEVLRACFLVERVGSSQIAGQWMHPVDDKQAVRTAHSIFARVNGSKAETICDFLIKNTPPISDTPWMPSIDGIVYLEHAESAEIFGDRERGWDVFRKRFPNSKGIIEFSRVGFDTESSQALICLGAQYDWLMGFGKYLFLQKSGGVWRIDAELDAWWS